MVVEGQHSESVDGVRCNKTIGKIDITLHQFIAFPSRATLLSLIVRQQYKPHSSVLFPKPKAQSHFVETNNQVFEDKWENSQIDRHFH